MNTPNFEEGVERILKQDTRFHRDSYYFLREALDYTQRVSSKKNQNRPTKHVTGQELLEGIRDYALEQFGPMTIAVLEEWGIKWDYQPSKKVSVFGNVAYYDMALTNVRTFGVLPEGIPPGSIGIVQSARDSAKGWEFEGGLRYDTGDGELNLIVTYTDGESATAADPRLSAVDFVPKKQSLMARYAWNQGSLSGLMLGATYFDQNRKRNATYWIDFPATSNLFGRYAWGKKWSVQLNLNNITDERYIVAIAGNGLVQTEPGFDTKLAVKYVW